jgi:rhamnosyl/mannosyltransferase
MKILQVNKRYYPHIGGMERYLYWLCNELLRYPDVTLTVLVCNNSLKTEVEDYDRFKLVRVASPGSFLGMPYAPSLPIWLRRIKADILHFHHPFPPGELAYLLVQPPGKIVVTWHSDIVRQRWALALYAPFLRTFLKRVDRILVSSPNYLEASSYLNDVREKCTVIPLGIDIQQFQLNPMLEQKVKTLRAQYGPRIILFVGRLVYYKGVEYLIKAMPEIEAKLILIGEGPLKKKLKEIVRSLSLWDKVVFQSPVPDSDLVAYYHACDVFVLPSVEITEAFGLVQLEAMACGKPVVSTALPTGVPFVNQHGKTGFIVPPRDHRALAQAINTLLSNPQLREQYGMYAKRRVEQEFNMKFITAKVMQVYKELL